RAQRYSVDAVDWQLDYSKQRIDQDTLQHLLALARECDLEPRRDAMFAGRHVNSTEDRAALHTALRVPMGAVIKNDGDNVVPEIQATLKRMGAFAATLRAGRHYGYSGRPIKNIVNIGIGGSDLGPVMADQALRHYADQR